MFLRVYFERQQLGGEFLKLDQLNLFLKDRKKRTFSIPIDRPNREDPLLRKYINIIRVP